MLKSVKSFFLLVAFMLCICFTSDTHAAFQMAKEGAPGLAVCEVNCYGENALRQEYFFTFEEMLIENLQNSKKFQMEDKQTFTPVLPDGTNVQLDTFFKELHQHSIINGKSFMKEEANIELVHYWDAHPGEKSVKDTYLLKGDFKDKVKHLAAQNNVKYLVFCNLKDVDVQAKTHTLGAGIKDLDGLKIRVDMDYYLINAETGLIYEGHSFTDKTAEVRNFILIQTGKTIEVQELVTAMLKAQAKRACDDICSKGLSMVKK